ncbi:ABC transporter substrate-binding protein [Roseomonas sp. NAR14]|uniref:ABC transporter substrate-binding protein n=1 Tax=Roseomonas acroporae TaxID=2937791 RepID=A0A9X2BVI3_9PROT|nr:ABC transporter substrate-binding protein [Roseomonas acroporae]MCK8784034.1 ABC transporter substrate-binding protein [Roseomonas acroporae]
MRRRQLLAAGIGATLAAPRIGRAQGSTPAARTLRFIPQADLSTLDPHWNTAYVTRNHGFMVFDTLYGQDAGYAPHPQMVAGHVVEDDGRRWTLTLREGLRWHDGTPVLARDCVASIRRWASRDGFGGTLMAATDELAAADDRRLVFRLRRPFPLLPVALGKSGVYMPAMMPERLALTPATTQVTEMVGSGPFRFVAAERVPGARAVYARNPDYVPLAAGTPSGTAGPKVVHLDRVEWLTTPDPATAAAALAAGEVDWWDFVLPDLVPQLRRNARLRVEVQDPAGYCGGFRMNHLHPPFDNPGVRRAVLGAIPQQDCMIAAAGDDPAMWRVPAGVFTPGSPYASEAGMAVLTAPRDLGRSRRALAEAGYAGEPVVLLVATDFPHLRAMSEVVADLLRRLGMVVDYQAIDWGSVLTRRGSRAPASQGGWSAFVTFSAGADNATPAGNTMLRANGQAGWFGWPDDPELEALRARWFDAPDLPARQAAAAAMQARAFETVPFVPLGQYFQATAYRRGLSGVLPGFATFWNLRKEG